MPSDPTGDVVRNLVTLRRIANGLSADVRGRVRELVDDFVAEIARNDPTGVTRERYRRERVEKVLAKLREVAGAKYPEMRRELEAALSRLGKQQALWAARTLDSSTGEVGAVNVQLEGIGIDRFRTILRTDPFHGQTMREWFGAHEQSTLRRVRQQVRLGMAQNETLGDIVRRIRGRSVGRGRFSGGVMDTSTREAEAIARTAVTFVSNRGHMEAYEANADVVEGVEVTATLDSRTTIICASLDGTFWRLNDPNLRRPPYHVRCRTVLTPRIDWKGLGMQPPEEGTRASAGGQVPSSTTYEDWFRGQPKSVQDSVIGQARAELFRDGKITFRDMIGKDNRVLTLEEIGA